MLGYSHGDLHADNVFHVSLVDEEAEVEEEKEMNEYIQIIVNAIATGVGMGAGIAIGTYFANKTFIQNVDRIASALKAKQNNEKEKEETKL